MSFAISPAPKDQDAQPLELAEDLLRERDGRVADRHGPVADARVRSDLLPDREGGVEEAVGQRAGVVPLGRGRV